MPLPHRSQQELWVCHLGTLRYLDALAIQEQVRALRQADELPDTLLLLEHPPVYTRGRRSGDEELPFGEDFYRAKGIDVIATDRGGQITYHGPGQLVGYPIMRIEDVHATCARWKPRSSPRSPSRASRRARARGEGTDYTGVWVGRSARSPRSACTSRAASPPTASPSTSTTTSSPFSWVIACGLPDVA